MEFLSAAIGAVRPHDLVRLSGIDGVLIDDAPPWVRDRLAATPWVVGRRAPVTPGLIAVGVRGASRALRHATFIPDSQIDMTVRPEELVCRVAPRGMPVFQALDELRSGIDAIGLPWGPVGSSGFELATGTATVNESSDLDLIVRIDRFDRRASEQLSLLADAVAGAAVRVDCQVQLPMGAVALSELLGRCPRILLRGNDGARLISREEIST